MVEVYRGRVHKYVRNRDRLFMTNSKKVCTFTFVKEGTQKNTHENKLKLFKLKH